MMHQDCSLGQGSFHFLIESPLQRQIVGYRDGENSQEEKWSTLAKLVRSCRSGQYNEGEIWHHELQERGQESSGLVQRDETFVDDIAGLYL
jgi:hypothetical protein